MHAVCCGTAQQRAYVPRNACRRDALRFHPPHTRMPACGTSLGFARCCSAGSFVCTQVLHTLNVAEGYRAGEQRNILQVGGRSHQQQQSSSSSSSSVFLPSRRTAATQQWQGVWCGTDWPLPCCSSHQACGCRPAHTTRRAAAVCVAADPVQQHAAHQGRGAVDRDTQVGAVVLVVSVGGGGQAQQQTAVGTAPVVDRNCETRPNLCLKHRLRVLGPKCCGRQAVAVPFPCSCGPGCCCCCVCACDCCCCCCVPQGA